MNTKNVDYVVFFKVLGEAVEAGDTIERDDDPDKLECAFVVNGQDKYVMPIKSLKCAKDAGIDVFKYLTM